ncbi:MAG: hypothetical protein ACRD3B_08320 [Candidatus Sulfotelmatobacter sp.]
MRDALKMAWYYAGKPVATLLRRTWLHPRFTTKYNALRRLAYFSVPVAGCLSVATGWSIHKPMQLHWLARCLADMTLPMVLLVNVTKGHRVCEKLIEVLGAGRADLFV